MASKATSRGRISPSLNTHNSIGEVLYICIILLSFSTGDDIINIKGGGIKWEAIIGKQL
jgi:hypothetical protein